MSKYFNIFEKNYLLIEKTSVTKISTITGAKFGIFEKAGALKCVVEEKFDCVQGYG